MAFGALIQRQPKTTPAGNQNAAQGASQVVVLATNLPGPVVGQTKKGTDGETSLTFKPDFKWKMKNGKITSYSGTLQPAIQTTFLPGADKKANSAYGRGTTAADKTAGNTTLEFHESMHIEDYKAYLTSHPLPEFKVKASPTEAEFRDAASDYAKALQKYSEDASEASKQSTDCVGVKEQTC